MKVINLSVTIVTEDAYTYDRDAIEDGIDTVLPRTVIYRVDHIDTRQVDYPDLPDGTDIDDETAEQWLKRAEEVMHG